MQHILSKTCAAHKKDILYRQFFDKKPVRGFFFQLKKKGSGAYRYGFNGKEQDGDIDGTGVDYDYGDRIFDTRLGRWLTVDKLFKNYAFASPYVFALNTPIQAKDPDGEKVLFVNGYYNTGKTDAPGVAWTAAKKLIADYMVGTVGGAGYWGGSNGSFVRRAEQYLNDNNAQFIDGTGKWNSSGQERYDAGYAWAKANYTDLVQGVVDKNGVQLETFKVVSHSMGAAYSEGIIKYLTETGLNVEKVIHLSPADANTFPVSTSPLTIQLEYQGDPVLSYKNGPGFTIMKNVDIAGEVSSANKSLFERHAATKYDPTTWDQVDDLERSQFKPKDESSGDYSSPGGYSKYLEIKDKFNTNFNTIKKDNNTYNKTADHEFVNYGFN